jgi:hypothetical protein
MATITLIIQQLDPETLSKHNNVKVETTVVTALKTTKNDEHHTCHHDNSKWRHPVTVTDQQEPIVEISSGSGDHRHWQQYVS